MTIKIDVTAEVKFGDNNITSIKVEPLSFSGLTELWTVASRSGKKAQANLQRSRVIRQTHFMAGDKRITPSAADIAQLPLVVAKPIIAALDVEQGVPGEVITEGDGITSPIVYKLGAPFELDKNKKGGVKISELEFMATTYGEVEDVLAAENEMGQTVALISTVANPMGVDSLTRLPAWVVDKISIADGVTIMRSVLPHF